MGTITSVKVGLEAEGDIKTRKRRSLETKTKRLLDGWTLENVSAKLKHINNSLHLTQKYVRTLNVLHRTLSVPPGIEQFSESVLWKNVSFKGGET